MGIKKEKKPKEEYVFDQDDFDKYVEYCKISYEYFAPKKDDYSTDKMFYACTNGILYFSYYCGLIAATINSYLFISSYLDKNLDNYTTAICILFNSSMIFIQILDLVGIRKNKEFFNNVVLDVEEKYTTNYEKWIKEIKLDYIKNKKKEFKENIKYEKLKEKELKRIKYWMPSWIYFIIRKIDNTVKYVGQTMNLEKRRKAHQRVKYPEKEYIFEPIERKDIAEIDSKEYFWIKQFGWNNLDNVTRGGSAIMNKKGFKRKNIVYDGPYQDEIERVEKWLEFIKNKK